MRRRLLIAAIFLLAGAVVNVVVASVICHSVVWKIGVASYNVGFRHDGFSFSVQTSNAGTHSKPVPQTVILYVGWPVLSLRSESKQGVWRLADAPGQGPFVAYTGRLRDDLLYALRPVWLGFITNTVFYAGILWLLLAASLPFRRFLRTSRSRVRELRGLCPACAYPMGEADVCSECGKALSSSVTVAT